MSNEEEAAVFYFSRKNGRRIRVSREEWEREWLNWWNKVSRERKRRETT
jgi:hypothetical protein